MRKVSVLGKAVPIWLIALVLTAIPVAAVLLQQYGVIETTVEVHQSIKLWDGEDWMQCWDGNPEACTFYHGPEEFPEPSPGGECVCFQHTLKNQMSVDGTVYFEHYGDPDLEGIEVLEKTKIGELGYYEEYYPVPYMEGYPYPVSQVLKTWECEEVIFDIDIEPNPQYTHTEFQLIIAEDDEGPALFLVGWDPARSTQVPTYKEYNGGWGAGQDLPEGIEVIGNIGDTHFTVIIDMKYFPDSCCSEYAWAVHVGAVWPQSGSSSTKFAKWPEDWAKWQGIGPYEDNWVGIPIEEPWVIPSGEEKHFCECYKFAENIAPGTYTIYTEVVPGVLGP